MRPFSVEVLKKGSAFAVGLIQPPEGVRLEPLSWGDSDRWGYEDARINATGPVEEIEQLLTWVGDWVQIRNEWGSVVWSGRIHEVEVIYGGTALTVNLDDVINRVRVAYSAQTANGGEISGITDWAENAESIEQFGVRELQLSLPDAGTNLPYTQTAVALRDRTLAQRAWPAPVLKTTSGTGTPRATLTCRSHWDELDHRYYANPNGLVEFVASGNETQPLWASITSTGISFEATSRINGPTGSFGNLKRGDGIHVSGATDSANNGLFDVAEDPTVSTQVRVSSTDIVTASAGPSITIAMEGAKAERVAQSFVLPAGSDQWKAKVIALRVRRHDPNGVGIAGNIVVELCADSGGAPGTVLDSKALTGPETNAIPESASWVEFRLAGGQVVLATATTYWIVVRHTTDVGLGRYIGVDVDTGLGYVGAGRIYNGSAWVARATDFHMPLRVTGAVDGLDMVAEMLRMSGAVSATTQEVVGQGVWQYRDGSRTARDEATEILDMGSGAGRSMLIKFRRHPWKDDGLAAIADRPDMNPATTLLMDRHGKLRWPNGEPWENGRLAAGMFVELEGMPALTGMTIRRRALWVERSEYDAVTDRLSLETVGARQPLAGMGVIRG